MKKIRIAFIKYGGLTAGGSEKLLQIIAAYLPKERFDVTYFYTDMAPSIGPSNMCLPTDETRKKFLEKHNVSIVKCSIQKIDLTSPFCNWVGTDFFEKFNEEAFDIIQTCRAGHKEFPFTKIRKKPIIDIIALSSGSDNQYNIARVLHICSWSVKGWVKRGGDKIRARIVSLPIAIEGDTKEDRRIELSLHNKFVYGMHQRTSNDIFSPFPLLAYSQMETQATAFVLMGGGDKYKKQAEELGIKNIHFLEATGDVSKVFSFLRTLDVYAHGRKDGEVNSQAMAEAMYVGLPIVSHVSKINNGHIECIKDAGKVVETVSEYQEELARLRDEGEYYAFRREKALERFRENYEVHGQIKRYIDIYEDVYKNPFPKPIRRFLISLHYTQNVRVLLVWVSLKFRKMKNVIV